MRRRCLRPALIAVLFACSPVGRLAAQHQPAPDLPEFEVASIKLADPNVPHMVGVEIYPGARVVIQALSLRSLVATAFRLSYWQVSGGDAWTETDRYDLEAKPPDHLRSCIKDLRHTLSGIEDERLRKMLQALLIDRFQLKFHSEPKTGNVYLLERSGKALRLQAMEDSSDPVGSIGYAGGTWVISATTMPQFAKYAADYVLHAPVMDRTELHGSFKYRQRVPDLEPNYTNNSDSFLRFVSELGFRLERSRGPVESLVIDHAAKPSPN